jgi:dTDP-glucose pyrophosphorylase
MINIVIPLAGEGKRFSSKGIDTPKPLVVVDGKRLIEHAVETLGIKGRYIFITKKYKNKDYNIELTNVLKSLDPDCIEIQVEQKQRGAADAVLYAEKYINNKDPLVIANCDQRMMWDAKKFINVVEDSGCDGSVVLFKATDAKHSFVEIINDEIVRIVEKDPISDDALIGIHYWREGSDFVWSAKKLLEDDLADEVYISQTYQILINEGRNIDPYFVPNNEYINLGTPEDVDLYIGKVKEFYTEKPRTIFCDIDGTIIKHVHKFSDLSKFQTNILPGVLKKFNEWDSKGHKIILTTARKESARQFTEKQLSEMGLPWDVLLMGVTSGTRVLINDKLTAADGDRARSINLLTNEGFENVYWEDYGL